ncbi:MAG: diguanylate cyclase [Gammaproteobacteria bacterium]|nr:diguanylate cyclase [Gammaproteobacteria bacterium]
MNNRPSISERMQKLRNSFTASIATRMVHTRALIDSLQLEPPPSEAEELTALNQLHHAFHSIKGNAASFGFDEMSDQARIAEAMIIARLETASALDDFNIELLYSICDFIEFSPIATAHVPQLTSPLMRMNEKSPQEKPPHTEQRKLVYLCDDEIEIISDLETQLNSFGYQLRTFTSHDTLDVAISEKMPDAIVMDIVFPDGECAGITWVKTFHHSYGHTIPIIYISGRDDFSARLKAVQSGGSAYCLKPFKPTLLLEALDNLTHHEIREPLKVMIVDDEADIARYHAMILEEAGILTTIVTQPHLVIERLGDFIPDLVLMDLYMPECSGTEMAQLLRQIPGHVSLPIVYLSSETDNRRQFIAMGAGADGFLTKPIDPPMLVQEIQLRGERMRILHSLMVRDSLTGLLNHTTIKNLLDNELNNARRRKSSLCFAMFDIDHFKQVNDTYGHPMGDQVILALSRLLQRRIRGSDAVGRYGGEEFALILTDVDTHNAERICNQLRIDFAQMTYVCDDLEFSCTLSGGLALFPQWRTAHRITDAADKALYRAKHNGRNRIEILTPEADELN